MDNPQYTHVHELTIPAYHAALLNGTTTCEQTVSAYLAQIDRYNPTLRAIVTVNENALDDARQKDIERLQFLHDNNTSSNNPTPEEADSNDSIPRKKKLHPLHGVPLLLKDTYTTTHLPTTSGVLALSTLHTHTNAPIVQTLLASGAILLAKTNLHEFSLEGTTTSSLGGQTLNPYDLTRTPGGSSGGTAAALAANMGLVGCGGDTMNSLRSPASACAVVGFRPTMGRVCTSGVMGVSRTQDALGPMGRGVGDVRVLWGVMKGSTASSATAAAAVATASTNTDAATDTPNPNSTDKENIPLRIGILTTYFPSSDSSNPESLTINNIMQTALQKIQSSPTLTRPIHFIPLSPQPTWEVSLLRTEADTQSFEFKEEMDSFLQSPFIKHTPHRSLASIAASDEYHKTAVTAVFHETLQTEKFNTQCEAYKARLQRIKTLKESVQTCFVNERLDAMVYPHQKNLVLPVGEVVQSGRNGILAALTGRPAVCIPAGFAQPAEQTPGPGIPVGLELMGTPWQDDELLDIAEVFEGIIQGRKPPLLTSDLSRSGDL
ncbi:amidase signature enzyme [Aspergillus campestris IBT 28561]|uniref:Amidase signature enzyme n=1 Tax=Aspergillus campestris (strain IBT 28561) TaxID=1392248 RepID=A0A2I1DHA5_ASPC2|nr:amidase signature enzyme [Aspergillus campestris IBT 28561]PKY09255.1 amidase signature enzyme [Aspergillus campestris IBT 28561]